MEITIDNDVYDNDPDFLCIELIDKIKIKIQLEIGFNGGIDKCLKINNIKYQINDVEIYNIYCSFFYLISCDSIKPKIYIFKDNELDGRYSYTYVKKNTIRESYKNFTSNFVYTIHEKMTKNYQFFYFFLIRRLIYTYIYDSYKCNGKYYKYLCDRTYTEIKNIYKFYYYKINIYIIENYI